MTEIVLSNRSLSSNDLYNQCAINFEDVHTKGYNNQSTIAANTPYAVKGSNYSLERSVLDLLTPHPVASKLTDLSLSLGEDNTIALSEIMENLKTAGIGFTGASTSVYDRRMTNFVGAVKNYQSALLQYRELARAKSPAAAAAKSRAESAFAMMQEKFRVELNTVTAGVKSRRGTPLTNPQRGLNIARSSRNAAKLNVTSVVEANRLVNLTKMSKLLGDGFALIDFGARAGNIVNEYKADGNWEREMFIESSSFAASALAGITTAKAGLAILLLFTPAGWTGLIVGGLAVAGASAASSITFNNISKSNAGQLYDWIMNRISLL